MSACDETVSVVVARREAMLEPDEVTAMLRLRKLGWPSHSAKGWVDCP